VFSGLASRADADLEFALLRGYYEYCRVGLACARNHVLDEVPMARRVDYGEEELVGFELLKPKVNRNTTFSLFLERVEDPCELESLPSPKLVRFISILGNCLLVHVPCIEE